MKEEKLGQEPAFPLPSGVEVNYNENGVIVDTANGMTKRFFAACAAMQGLLGNGNKMIEELKKKLNDKGELELKDNWGNTAGLELRIPNEGGSWSIHRVPFHLALDVIKEHIANQEKELVRLREVCRVQLA